MCKIRKWYEKYKQAIKAVCILAVIGSVYHYLPYCLMEKPVIREIVPDEMPEKALWNSSQTVLLKGENLYPVIGVYLNGVWEKNCKVLRNTEDEVEIYLPAEYTYSAQTLDMQVEVRINSDLTCLSPKSRLHILSSEDMQVPLITEVMPQTLRYEDALQQEIVVYGEHLTEDSVLCIDGREYEAVYEENTGCLRGVLPYADWCGKSELSVQIKQNYKGYQTSIISEKYALYAQNNAPEKTQEGWSKERILAVGFGEWKAQEGSNTREVLEENYRNGQRLFGMELMLSSDGILLGKRLEKENGIFLPDTLAKEKAVQQEYTLLSFAELCELGKDYPEAYFYVDLQEAGNLAAWERLYRSVIVQAKTADILDRILFPYDSVESYHLLLDLYAAANCIYVPAAAVTEEEIEAVVQDTACEAAILSQELLSAGLLEMLTQQECLVYVAGLSQEDEDTTLFQKGAYGLVTDRMTLREGKVLVETSLANQTGEETLFEEQEKKEQLRENRERMQEYLRRLDSERYLVVMAVKDDGSLGMTAQLQNRFYRLGLQKRLCGQVTQSYLAVLSKGEVFYEELSSEALLYEGVVEELQISAKSAGFYVGNDVSIQIDGVEYAVKERGINIVVYDTLLDTVADSVCFDMYDMVKLLRRETDGTEE